MNQTLSRRLAPCTVALAQAQTTEAMAQIDESIAGLRRARAEMQAFNQLTSERTDRSA